MTGACKFSKLVDSIKEFLIAYTVHNLLILRLESVLAVDHFTNIFTISR